MRSLFTPWLVIPPALIGMGVTIYAAALLDWHRLYDEAQARAAAIDAEQLALEQRFCELTAKHEPQAAEIFDPASRHFRAVIERYRARTPRVDDPATTPELRHYRDEAAGIIRRWEVLDADHQQAAAEVERRAWIARPSS